MTQQTSLDFDTSRGRDNQHSQAAFKKIKQTKKQAQYEVWKLVQDAGVRGITCEEAAAKLNKAPSAISGRFSELVRDGTIAKKLEKGRTKLGNSCAIFVTRREQ